MRYLDWDVLLFPADGSGTHVPLKEFRTACCTEQQDAGQAPTPLLTTFIPSLPKDAPFQVSVHSWSETRPMLRTALNGTAPQELWHVKVVIDGACMSMETFPVDVGWPQVIAHTSASATGSAPEALKFPKFHRSILSQNHWSASDQMGRIRVELSAGYAEPKTGRFVKMFNIVNLAFQAAPLDCLEQNGIAWPNPRMVLNPLQPNAYINNPVSFNGVPLAMKHKKVPSGSNTFTFPGAHLPMPGMVVPTATSPLIPIAQDSKGNYETASRSTSAYSHVSDTAAPLLQKLPLSPAYPGSHADKARKDHPFSFRLPSDQLQMILNAIQPSTQLVASNQQATGPSATMPPPPLPAHAVASKDAFFGEERTTGVGPTAQPLLRSNGDNVINRRDDSRYSDVSMHAGCNGFPSCTSEDAEGHLVHNTPTAPATVVKGRKEGSSPTKPRDFFSTILDTEPVRPTSVTMETPAAKETGLLSSSPADSQGKKRTRSALKLLNINDGSPEKKDAAKPPRKASKSSISSFKSDKENVTDAPDAQENMILDL